ncbi:GNAT family protein [Clostridium sp. Ade.TY]|uniref:GNAT family N-acetyltransferase n=1 Tax=Clostridium sp. Ade.TY TaxID=1391647 RepID=UPI000409AA71|nr:GNAT family protein [Clostridium sp. Ade.TY]
MLKLCGKNIYLSAIEREHCMILWAENEYDFNLMTEPLNIGHSIVKSDLWFNEIQELQGNTHIRLGIFLNDGTIIGDIALQNINWQHRSCDVGAGIAKIENRSKGYGGEALKLLLEYGFNNLGLERISATTLEQNILSKKLLIKTGFVQEGVERKAFYFAGKRWDKLNYGMLREEYNK